MEKGDFFLQFQSFLQRKGVSRGTIRRTMSAINFIFKNVQCFEFNELTEFIFSLQEQGKKNSYLNTLICAIRLFSQANNLDEKLKNFPFLSRNQSIKATMSDEEIEAFLNLPPPKNASKKEYARWTLFFSIMAYTGMRPGEVARLKIDNVDFGRGVFILEETKTHQPRFVPIPPNLENQLREYIKTLPTDFLFSSQRKGNCQNNGSVFDNVDWHYNFHQRIKRLGIKRKNLTPYSLRHSFITRLLEEDVNLFKVQKIVGHRQIETTAQYTHLTTKDIQLAIKKHPLIRKETSPQNILFAIKESLENFNLKEDKRFSVELVEKENLLKIEIKIIS